MTVANHELSVIIIGPERPVVGGWGEREWGFGGICSSFLLFCSRPEVGHSLRITVMKYFNCTKAHELTQPDTQTALAYSVENYAYTAVIFEG